MHRPLNHLLPTALISLLLTTFTTLPSPALGQSSNSTTQLNQGDLSKRGLAYIYTEHSSADAPLFTTSNSPLSWYYNWASRPAFPSSPVLFVPMIHSLDNLESDIATIRSLSIPDDDKYILVLNEPDHTTDGGGTNISPRDAARAWIEDIAALRDDGWRLSLPATTGASSGLEWLAEFNESCYALNDDEPCDYDFVATHWYGDFTGLAAWTGTLHETYPDQDIWVTEFALPQQDSDATGAMMNDSLVFLDRLEYVARYAWFGAFREHDANGWTGDEVSLLDEEGGLTDLGVTYLGGEGRGFDEGMRVDGSTDGEGVGGRVRVDWRVIGVVLGMGMGWLWDVI